MSEADDRELDELFAAMNPKIADLMRRMMALSPETWAEAKACRDEILAVNVLAKTDAEQASLAFAMHRMPVVLEERGFLDPVTFEEVRKLMDADYRMILWQQSLVDDLADPDRLEQVTRREVEAGRLAAHDSMRILTVAGSEALGKGTPKAKPKSLWDRLRGR